MNDLKNKFLAQQEKTPMLGDTLIFLRTVRGMGLSRAKVFSAFNRFVSKDDYAPREKEKLVDWIIASAK